MLPAATHDIWSTWPVGWTVVAGTGGGVALLCSIGLAQAWATPREVRRTATWVGWTALGWGAGLTAFGVIAPPLWHEGQAPWVLTLIGLCGGLAMAFAMAAVTGLGAVRLVARGTGTFGSNGFPVAQAGSRLSGNVDSEVESHVER
jgi:Ca2+-transporting ATPase